jgi:hypothetical protein
MRSCPGHFIQLTFEKLVTVGQAAQMGTIVELPVPARSAHKRPVTGDEQDRNDKNVCAHKKYAPEGIKTRVLSKTFPMASGEGAKHAIDEGG